MQSSRGANNSASPFRVTRLRTADTTTPSSPHNLYNEMTIIALACLHPAHRLEGVRLGVFLDNVVLGTNHGPNYVQQSSLQGQTHSVFETQCARAAHAFVRKVPLRFSCVAAGRRLLSAPYMYSGFPNVRKLVLNLVGDYRTSLNYSARGESDCRKRTLIPTVRRQRCQNSRICLPDPRCRSSA